LELHRTQDFKSYEKVVLQGTKKTNQVANRRQEEQEMLKFRAETSLAKLETVENNRSKISVTIDKKKRSILKKAASPVRTRVSSYTVKDELKRLIAEDHRETKRTMEALK
jgi:hypothetical protein